MRLAARCSDAAAIVPLINSIDAVCYEAVLRADDDGLRVDALSADEAYAAYIKLPAGVFDDYAVEQPAAFPIDVKNLAAPFRKLGKGSGLSIDADEKTLKLTFMGKGSKKYELRLLASNVKEAKPGGLKAELPGSATISADALRDAVEESARIRDEFTCLRFLTEGVEVSAEGEMMNFSSRLSGTEAMGMTQDAYIELAPSKLRSILGMAPRGSMLTVKYGTNMPIEISHESESFSFKGIVAPRIGRT